MKIRIVSGLVAGVIVLAACGEKSVTKAEFITKGDAICKKGDAKLEPLFEQMFSGGGPDPEKLKTILPKVVAEIKSVRNDLVDLSGPADGEKVIDAAAKDIDKGVAGLDAVIAAAKKGDEDAGEKLFGTFDNFEAADEKTRTYGFKVCGSEDEDEGDEGDEAPSDLPADQQAFVDQGDAICKAASEKLEPIFGQLFGSANLTKKAEALGQLGPIVREQNDALKALAPPAAIQAQFKGITDAYDANLVKVDELKALAEKGDKAAYDAAFEKVGESFDGPDDEFGKLGFKECGDN